MIGTLFSLGAAAASAYGQYASSRSNADWGMKKQLSYDKQLFDYQNRFNLLQSPSMQMEGLRKAGINPMVAYGSVGSSASMPSVSSPSASPLDFSSAVSTGLDYLSANRSYRLQKERNNVLNNVDLANSSRQQAKLESEIDSLRASASLDIAKASTESHLPGKIQKEIERMSSDIALNYLKGQQIHSEIGLNSAQREKIINDTIPIGKQIEHMNSQIKKATGDRYATIRTKVKVDWNSFVKAFGPISSGSSINLSGEFYLGDLYNICDLHGISFEKLCKFTKVVENSSGKIVPGNNESGGSYSNKTDLPSYKQHINSRGKYGM